MLQEMRYEGGLTLLVCEAGLRSARGFQALCLWCAVAPALPWGAVLISCPDTLMPGSDEWGSSILSPLVLMTAEARTCFRYIYSFRISSYQNN